MPTLLFALVFFLVPSLNATLVASYDLDGNAVDGSGFGHDGSVFGNPAFVADRFGNPSSALSLDGIDDFVNIPHFQLEGPVSVSGWFSFSENIWPKHIALLGQATDYYQRWTLGASNDEIFWYDRRGSDNYPYNIIRTTSMGDWHHLAAVADVDPQRTEKVALFLDGTLIGRVSSRGFGDIGADYQIGSFFTEWGWEHSLGSVDEIRIFDHALSESEIAELYAGQAVPEPGTLALMILGLMVLAGVGNVRQNENSGNPQMRQANAMMMHERGS